MWGKFVIAGKSQKGFTLIELIIALAIGMAIIGALAGAIYQVFAGSNSSSNNMMAVRQVQNVGYWVSLDVQQSKLDYITVDYDAETPEVFIIVWTEISWDLVRHETLHRAVYRLVDGALYRDYYSTAIDGTIYSLRATTLIAQYIDNNIPLVKSVPVVLTVSATVNGWKQGTAERTYEIETRVD